MYIDVEQMYKQRQPGKLPVEETPFISKFNSNDQNRQLNAHGLSKSGKKHLPINQQDLLQQNISGLQGASSNGNIKRFFVVPNQAKQLQHSQQTSSKQSMQNSRASLQHASSTGYYGGFSGSSQRPQSSVVPKTQSLVLASNGQSVRNNFGGGTYKEHQFNEFQSYVHNATQHSTPQEQEFYNNLLHQTRNNKFNMIKPGSQTVEAQSLQSILKHPLPPQLLASKSHKESPSKSNLQHHEQKQLRLKIKRNTETHQVLNHIDEVIVQENIERNKFDMTPQEKISHLISQSQMQRQHQQSQQASQMKKQVVQKQMMFIKKQLYHQRAQNSNQNCDPIQIEMLKLTKLINEEAARSSSKEHFANLIQEQVQNMMEVHLKEKHTQHWNKFNRFYRNNSIHTGNQVSDFWKTTLHRQYVNYLPKSYQINNHMQLYQDIGEILMKSQGILESEIVDPETKDRFVAMLTCITQRKELKENMIEADEQQLLSNSLMRDVDLLNIETIRQHP